MDSLDNESLGSSSGGSKSSSSTGGLWQRGWYHGPISRTGAVEQVTNPGDFLVRDCISSPGNLVLTTRNAEGKILHFRLNQLVEKDEDGTTRTYFQFEDDCFDTVSGTVQWYTALVIV